MAARRVSRLIGGGVLFNLFLMLPASAADLHHCEGTLTRPNGASLTVKGFGDTEDEAKTSTEQAARLLASQAILIGGIQAWLGGADEQQAAIESTLTNEGSKQLGAPGWKLDLGACAVDTITDGASYTATWSEGAEDISRPTPALAMEAARRRACVPTYQRRLLEKIEPALGDPEQLSTLSELETVLDGIAACWSAEPPTVNPSDKAIEASSGATRCSAIGPDASAIALGFGGDPEHAAEHALRQNVLVRTLTAVSALADHSDLPDPSARIEKMAPAIRSLVGLSGSSDTVDRARLACANVTPSRMTWRAVDKRAKACNAASWLERPKSDVPGDQAAAFVDGTCQLQIAPTFQIVRFAARSADSAKKRSMLSSAYKVSGDCAATCYREVTWGEAPKAVRLAGAPDRSSKRAVTDSLKPLAEGKSLTGLELLPTLQEPAALKSLLDGEVSKKLRPELRTLHTKADRWKEIDGNWILLP